MQSCARERETCNGVSVPGAGPQPQATQVKAQGPRLAASRHGALATDGVAPARKAAEARAALPLGWTRMALRECSRVQLCRAGSCARRGVRPQNSHLKQPPWKTRPFSLTGLSLAYTDLPQLAHLSAMMGCETVWV